MPATKKGLLWLLPDAAEPATADSALDRYREKYGRKPGDIRIHPDTRKSMFEGAKEFGGCRLIDDESVPRQHLWIRFG